MHDIIFRGKVVNSGEWVEGELVHFDLIRNNRYGMSLLTKNMGNEGDFKCSVFRVDPITIGQYTRAKDVNGDKIFEGDTVRCWGGKFRHGIWEHNNEVFIDDITKPHVMIHLWESENIEIIRRP